YFESAVSGARSATPPSGSVSNRALSAQNGRHAAPCLYIPAHYADRRSFRPRLLAAAMSRHVPPSAFLPRPQYTGKVLENKFASCQINYRTYGPDSVSFCKDLPILV